MVARSIALCLAIVVLVASCHRSQAVDYDLVIRGGTVFDGNGEPGVVADVAVRGDRIVAVGDVNGRAARSIDAGGLYVTPGFIDMHSHSETFRLLNGGQGPSFALQGFTTEIYGEELEQMPELVQQSMREGALGVSAGMGYVPNIYMTSDELTSIVREAANMGGIFANQARTMNGTDPDAIHEAIAIGEQAGAAIHFFHLNSTSSTQADTFLAIIDEARERGVKITGDSYTYTWGITGLRAYIPAWAQAGGVEAMLERLRDPLERERIAAGFVTEPPYLANIGWHHVRLRVDNPEVNGKRVSEVARLTEQAPEEVFMDVVLEQEGRGIVIDWNNEEDTLQQVLAQPYVAGVTDGSALDLDSGNLPPLVHPRRIGTVPHLQTRPIIRSACDSYS